MTVYIIMKRLYDTWVPEGSGFVDELKAQKYCNGNNNLIYREITVNVNCD